MDEILGFIVVIGIIGLLMYELIRQIKVFKSTKNGRFSINSCIMFFSLFGILIFYCLNILVALDFITNEYITSNSTSIGTFLSFAVYIIVKFRKNNKKQKFSIRESLLK